MEHGRFRVALVVVVICGALRIAPAGADESEPAQSSPLIDSINANLEYLQRLARWERVSGQASRAEKALSERLPHALSSSKRSHYLYLVEMLALNAWGPRIGSSGYLDDPICVEVFAYALADPAADLRLSACRTLVDRGRSVDLRRNAAVIRKGVPQGMSTCLAYLLVASGADKDVVSEITGPDLPRALEAKLGDSRAFAEVAGKFVQAGTYQAKMNSAHDLGFIGSWEAERLLVQDLGSNLITGQPGCADSIRIELLRALGRIHPDSLLLTYWLVWTQSRDRNAQRKYLGEVSAWVRTRHGVQFDVESLPMMLNDYSECRASH